MIQPSTERLEQLAAYAHNAWARYMDYFLERLPIDPLTGARQIDILYYNNLRRLITMQYDKLSPQVKELDRDEARAILVIIEGTVRDV